MLQNRASSRIKSRFSIDTLVWMGSAGRRLDLAVEMSVYWEALLGAELIVYSR